MGRRTGKKNSRNYEIQAEELATNDESYDSDVPKTASGIIKGKKVFAFNM